MNFAGVFQIKLASLLWMLAALVMTGNADAQRVHHIESTLPRVGQRGTTVEVFIRGIHLSDPQEILFYRPGIRATFISPAGEVLNELGKPVKYSLAHGGRIEEELKCTIEIARDCPLGEHPFHIRRSGGLTMLGTFHVTPFPVVDEAEANLNTNDSLQTATPVELNTTVRGFIKQRTKPDVDLYRVSVKAGQRVAAELDAVSIADTHVGASEFDLALRILDDTGRVLASSDDTPLHVQDPVAAIKAPRDGVVFLEVKQANFTPLTGAMFALGGLPYSLHVGNYHRPLAAYPAGGQSGSKVEAKLLGDPLGEEIATITVPEKSGTFDYFGNAPSPLPLRASAYGNVLEGDSSAPTRVSELPTALNGIISVPGERDAFHLTVKKGSAWRVRVFAASLGTPLDPVVRLSPLDAAGKAGPVELEADDSTLVERDIFGHYPRSGGGLRDVLDPSFVWTPKSEGDYLLEISDASGGGSPTCVYRIEIESPRDGIIPVLFNQGCFASQGSNQGLLVRLEKSQGTTFDGEIDLVASGLPEGVEFVCPRVPKSMPFPIVDWPVLLKVPAGVRTRASLFTIEARTTAAALPLLSGFQWKAPFIFQVGGDAFHLVQQNAMAFAVADPAPFAVEVSPPAAALVRNGELSVPVKIQRRPGFTGEITLDVFWLPTGVGKEAAVTVAPEQTDVSLKISASSNAKIGVWPLSVRAAYPLEAARGRGSLNSDFVGLIVAEPFVDLTAQPTSVRRGARASYVWVVKGKADFEGAARVRLLGLPKGVRVVGDPPEITRTTAEIVFEIEAAEDALLGPVQGVACEIMLTIGGQEIRQRSGNATLRIDPKL